MALNSGGLTFYSQSCHSLPVWSGASHLYGAPYRTGSLTSLRLTLPFVKWGWNLLWGHLDGKTQPQRAYDVFYSLWSVKYKKWGWDTFNRSFIREAKAWSCTMATNHWFCWYGIWQDASRPYDWTLLYAPVRSAYPQVLYVNTMKLSSSVLSTKVTQVCFSQCLMACLKIALWLPEKEIEAGQTFRAPFFHCSHGLQLPLQMLSTSESWTFSA